jgi:hypothetical protein
LGLQCLRYQIRNPNASVNTFSHAFPHKLEADESSP